MSQLDKTENSNSAQTDEHELERARNVPFKTIYYLFTRAGGRCEFRGCNTYLLEHHVTGNLGNYGEKGHVYAFRERGARGLEPNRPENIHHISNLIFLCHPCHKLVDIVRPDDYPIALLRQFKQEHEDRIYTLTAVTQNRKTVPIVFKGLVADRDTQVSDNELLEAVLPNYPVFRDKLTVDLSPIPDTPDAPFWTIGQRKIDAELDRLDNLGRSYGDDLHLSIFALAPIPLLMYLGFKLSDKRRTSLFQRHREPESWKWKDGPGVAKYQTELVSSGSRDVAMLLNLSGQNSKEAVIETIGPGAAIYELTLSNPEPSPRYLDTLDDLVRFRSEYEHLLAHIRSEHPRASRVHVFPAVPAPVAVMCGLVRLPKVDPPFAIYDRDKRSGGFTYCLELP